MADQEQQIEAAPAADLNQERWVNNCSKCARARIGFGSHAAHWVMGPNGPVLVDCVGDEVPRG